MGIKGLTKLIADEAPGASKEIQMEELMGRKIAVDASMTLYQFLVSILQYILYNLISMIFIL